MNLRAENELRWLYAPAAIVRFFVTVAIVTATSMFAAHARDGSLELQEYKHRGCLWERTDYYMLPEYRQLGFPKAFKYPDKKFDFKPHSSCTDWIKERSKLCELAIKHTDFIIPSIRNKCLPVFVEEVSRCRSHYERERPKCESLWPSAIFTDSPVQERKKQQEPESADPSSRASGITDQSPWEELIPDESPGVGWEELIPDESPGAEWEELRREEERRRTLQQQREEERRRILQQRRGEERRRIVQQRREEERQRIVQQQREEERWRVLQQQQQENRKRFADRQRREWERQQIADRQRREQERQALARGQGDKDELQQFLKGFNTGLTIVQGVRGLLGKGSGGLGSIESGAGGGSATGACEQARMRAARRLEAQNVSGGGSQCGIRRASARMLEDARRELASGGCPASEIQEYDRAIAETRRQARLVCN